GAGARLAALARGDAVPEPCADADVHEVVAAVLADQPSVAAFELRPGGTERDLIIALTLTQQDSAQDPAGLAAGIGNAVMARLGGRLRRGIAIWLGGMGGPASEQPLPRGVAGTTGMRAGWLPGDPSGRA